VVTQSEHVAEAVRDGQTDPKTHRQTYSVTPCKTVHTCGHSTRDWVTILKEKIRHEVLKSWSKTISARRTEIEDAWQVCQFPIWMLMKMTMMTII